MTERCGKNTTETGGIAGAGPPMTERTIAVTGRMTGATGKRIAATEKRIAATEKMIGKMIAEKKSGGEARRGRKRGAVVAMRRVARVVVVGVVTGSGTPSGTPCSLRRSWQRARSGADTTSTLKSGSR